MRVLPYAIALLLATSLAGCVTPPKAAIDVPTKVTGDQRKAVIRDQLKAICPVPLTADELNRDADLVEKYPDVLPLGNDLFRLHQSSVLCRTGKAL